ncbi:hypothetical protein O6H91_01G071400 [Diphasiastrum complanatum]|uniref:Uncharacterized protein n=1 Tax=Diphasiastrum complanatum TaxID=34168 RepID=A0ACC2ES22_DIPCM|nr:hypothetical protein O6H91_01G071400 [Diphasiastrum complanatum]
MKIEEIFGSVVDIAPPSPSQFWSSGIRKAPLPTNSFWQNYVLGDGSVQEYIHPFLVQFKGGSVSICYPTRAVQPGFIFQVFVPDLTISSEGGGSGSHVVTRYDDLSVTLELQQGKIKVPLVRGSPYFTVVFRGGTPVFSTIHAVLHLQFNKDRTKHRIEMNNGQTWLVYSSAALQLSKDLTCSEEFVGVIRISILTAAESEPILDRFSTTYAVGGSVDLSVPFQVRYNWKKKGLGELLMLSLPLHREILSSYALNIPGLVFESIDGKLEGIIGDSWVLQDEDISIGWYSAGGVRDSEERDQLAAALEKDVDALSSITTNSTYFYGKALARAARLALIAEEICFHSIVQKVRVFLVNSINPWLDGTFPGNAILYDPKWGGLISKNGASDPGADFGLGLYNDHHYHWGYFCYAGAVLAKLDPGWGRIYKPHLYALVGDYMNLKMHNDIFPRLRNFDPWLLHSWAGGLTVFADGRNQESTSEAVNAYYAASLVGLVYGDLHLIHTGLTLAVLESRSARSLWHVPFWSSLYESQFVDQNRVVSVLWASKRDSGLWFAPADWLECRLGIQLLPITPITDYLFKDVEFVQELVEWTWPALSRPGVGDGWKGFVYALQAMYARGPALSNTLSLQSHDDGNSLSNMLWWIFSQRHMCLPPVEELRRLRCK